MVRNTHNQNGMRPPINSIATRTRLQVSQSKVAVFRMGDISIGLGTPFSLVIDGRELIKIGREAVSVLLRKSFVSSVIASGDGRLEVVDRVKCCE